jgi:hypothetical protein
MLALALTVVLTAAPPEVALLSSRGDGDFTELRFQRPGAELSAPVAGFSHVRRATVLGTLMPGTRTVLAVAQTLNARDASFASSLVRLEAGREPATLVEHLALSTRPTVTRAGRVFIQRAGTVDEVNVVTGATRTIHRFEGPLLFIAGTFESELVLYRVGAAGADLVAVHEDALGVRVLVPRLPALARDFSVDGGSLYFTQGDGAAWRVDRVDLRTGELNTVARGPAVTLLPTVLPQGLALSPGPGQGLRYVNAGPALAARGAGYDRVRFVRDGWALGLDEVPSSFPTAFAVELKTGKALSIAAPPQCRLDLAGVAE